MAKRRTPWNIGNGREATKELRWHVQFAILKYPGIRIKEIAFLVAANEKTVQQHVRAIRDEWRDDYMRQRHEH